MVLTVPLFRTAHRHRLRDVDQLAFCNAKVQLQQLSSADAAATNPVADWWVV